MTSAVPSASCPKCGATDIRSVPVKRSSLPAAAAEHFHGAGSGAATSADTVLQNVCARCGCRWIPRTVEERHLRAASGQLGPEAMHSAREQDAARSARARLPKAAKRTVVFVVLLVIVIVIRLLV
jgi:hypothetical protein